MRLLQPCDAGQVAGRRRTPRLATTDTDDAGGPAVRDDHLHAFLGDARADSAIGTRRRRRWLSRQLDEERTFADVCADLAAARAPVDVMVANGRRHRGRLVVAHAEVVVVDRADGMAYIAATAVTGVRVRTVDVRTPEDAERSTTRPPPIPAGVLDDVLHELAAGRARIEAATVDGGVHRGRIEGVGRDLLRLSGGIHLRLSTLTEVIPVT